MSTEFGDMLKKLRTDRNLSQQQLAAQVFVNRSTLTNWENGRRLPDAIMIRRLAACLGVDVGFLLGAATDQNDRPEVIIADDEKLILAGSMAILEEALPGASIAGFNRGEEALAYARTRRISVAFLDIEMGVLSGLELCRELLALNPETNVVFLTAFKEYAFDAWESGACGFLMKPLSVEDVQKQMSRLRYPVKGLE